MKKKTTKISYLLKGTPSILLVLGAGFVMASTASIKAALGMSVAVLLSMLLSSFVISAIHKIIPKYAKLPAYLLIITGFVSLISRVMEAHCPETVKLLGVHLATLSVSAVIYRDAEEVADHNGKRTTVKTAIVTGVFFTVVMLVCALIRVVLGTATIFGYSIAFLDPYKLSFLVDENLGALGGYFVLAIVVAIINKITGLHHHLEEENTKEDECK